MKNNSIWLMAIGLLLVACGDDNGGRSAGSATSAATTETAGIPVSSDGAVEPPAGLEPATPAASRCSSTATSAMANLYFDGHLYMQSSNGSVMTDTYLRLKGIGACEGGQNTRCSILSGNNPRIVIDGIGTGVFPTQNMRNVHFEKLVQSGFCKQGVAPHCTLQPGNVLAINGVGAHYDSPIDLINQLRSLNANGSCQ